MPGFFHVQVILKSGSEERVFTFCHRLWTRLSGENEQLAEEVPKGSSCDRVKKCDREHTTEMPIWT